MKFHVLGILIAALTLLDCGRYLRAHEIDDDLLDFPFDDNTSETVAKLDGSFSNGQEAVDRPDLKLDDFGDEFDDSKLDDFREEFLYSKPEAKLDDFGDEFEDSDPTQSSDGAEHFKKPSFISNKEKLIRTALVKAFTNKALRQKFVEVVPILRALSKPQRLAFASLLTTQINAKPGQELKLKQVESLFGDSRKLILPIVFDIANLVKHAAKSVLNNYNVKSIPKPEAELSRRTFEVLPGEEDDIGEYEEYMDDIMDAKQINEGLYSVVANSDDSPSNSTRSRSKRSPPLSFFDRLSFLMPRTIQRRSSNDAYHMEHRILNTSNILPQNSQDQQALSTESVQTATDEMVDNPSLPYEQIEDLAFNDLNGTDIEVNPTNSDNGSNLEELPKPESLVRSRPRIVGNKLGHGHRKPVMHLRQPIRSQKVTSPLGNNCERFTSSMCIRSEDYPMEQIMGSIRRHRNAMSALLAEYRDKTAEVEHQEYLDDLVLNKKRREDDNGTPGGMCTSVVRYARPQKARSATGEWKYIVNTGQHTQTLRLEKCSNPQESCSFLTDNYRSRCIQVYNYHRLLSWDKMRGLHVDIFKVPTCCSCHVDGYRDLFPPLGSNGGNKLKDYNQYSKVNPYSTITDDEEYDDEEESDSDSIAYQFGNGFKKVKSNKYDPLYSSSNIKPTFDIGKSSLKTNQRSPSLGTYLSPPYDDFDPNYSFKRGPELSAQLNAGRLGGVASVQHGSLHNGYNRHVGDRLDQDVGGSEGGKEVTVYPPIDRSTVRPKRKRISSVSTAQQIPTTRETRLSGLSPSVATDDAPYSSDTVRNTQYTGTDSKTEMNKRINYNYHPIIDFFGDQARNLPSSRAAVHSSTTGPSFTGYRTKNEIHNGVGIVDNNWRPVVIE